MYTRNAMGKARLPRQYQFEISLILHESVQFLQHDCIPEWLLVWLISFEFVIVHFASSVPDTDFLWMVLKPAADI